MKRGLILLAVAFALAVPARASTLSPPPAPDSVADAVEQEADTFAGGLANVLRFAVRELNPSLREAAAVCLQVTAAILVCSLVGEFSPGISGFSLNLAACAAIAGILFSAASSMVSLGEETVRELSDYGKLLLPVMTGGLAAQGGIGASTALYAGTAFFDSLLSSLICRLLLPLVRLFLVLAVADGVLGQPLLGRLKALLRWMTEWGLKILLYCFTGYMTVTGVVSGSADAAAVKAAKITISGAVPVVGGILSDATETVLVSARTLSNTAGIYGLLTVIALFAAPFFRMGVQYLMLKAVSAVSAAFGGGRAAGLVGDFSTAMGLLLAMVSTQTVLLLVSTVCFMKGV